MSDVPSTSFLARHEFLLRRLHSLSGVVPVGAYMCVHLGTNSLASVSPAMFQRAVDQIHALGPLLWIVEWTFIFLPIIYHALYGVLIIRTGQSNSTQYRYQSNLQYTLQRITGMVALLFIAWHVFHMHGWFHFPAWHDTATKIGGAQFSPLNATSTAAEAMKMNALVPILYFIGVGSCIYHLANGLWTFGITWGLWVNPESQRRAAYGCGAFGVVLSLVGIAAWAGFLTTNIEQARAAEEKRIQQRLAAGEITPEEVREKSAHGHAAAEKEKQDQEVVNAAESSGS